MLQLEFSHSRIDLETFWQLPPTPDGPQGPQDVIRRDPADVWQVALSPIFTDQRPIQWAVQRQQTHVQIPLIPYLLSSEPDLALAYMWQLAFTAAVKIGKPIRRLHLATGVPVETLDGAPPTAALRFHIGVAALLLLK